MSDRSLLVVGCTSSCCCNCCCSGSCSCSSYCIAYIPQEFYDKNFSFITYKDSEDNVDDRKVCWNIEVVVVVVVVVVVLVVVVVVVIAYIPI